MEKFAFKSFMENEVVQKTIIFADSLNLNITGWKPSHSKEHPYRIFFFSMGVFVGYIEGKTRRNRNTNFKTDMPFRFWTPFGKVNGKFSTRFECFKYSFENEQLDKISGLFWVKNSGSQYSQRYTIGSSVHIGLDNYEEISVRFNCINSNYDIELIRWDRRSYESVNLCSRFDSYLSIGHCAYPILNEKRMLAKINVELADDDVTVPVNFTFLNGKSYQKMTDVDVCKFKTALCRRRAELFDYDMFAVEINENDPRMNEFIDEIREKLTLLANGTTPVCLYDKMANICFPKARDGFKLALSRAHDVGVAFEHSMILKKMEIHDRVN